MAISINENVFVITMLILTITSILYVSSIMDDIDTNHTDCCSCRVDL